MPKKTQKKTDSNSAVNKTNAADVAIKALKKKFGEEVIDWLPNAQRSNAEVIPTGSLALDSALGIGGVMRGRLYEFYGPNASGKTTLALLVSREAIKKGYKIAIIDAEHTLDKKLLESMGLDPDYVVLVRGYTGEQNLDIAEALMATGEFAICIIDSISALQPSSEANLESFDDNTMGLQPRLMSRMCRTFTPLASRTNTALILINQVRSNIGGYGNPETTSGGNALKHHVSGRIRVTGGGVKNKQIKNGKGEVVGHRVSFEVTKNKLAPPYRSAEVDLIYGKGFHQEAELLDLSVDMGFVDQSGSWFSYNGERIGQGRTKAITTISDNDKLKQELMVQVGQVLGLKEKSNE